MSTMESARKVAVMKAEHGEGHRFQDFCIADGEPEGVDLALDDAEQEEVIAEFLTS